MTADRPAPPGSAVREWLLGALVVGLVASITLSETTLVLLAVWLAWSARRPDAPPFRWPLAAPILIFAAWSVLAAAASAYPLESVRALRGLLTLGTVWVVAGALPDALAARRFATALFVSSAIVALASIVQYAACPADGGFAPPAPVPLVGGFFRKCYRAHGFFSIYMTLAGVLVLVLVAALPRLLTLGRRAWPVAAWLADAAALALTFVRGAWLGLAVGVAVVLLGVRRRVVMLGALAVVVVVLVVALPGVLRRIETIGDPNDPTTRERFAMLDAGRRLIAEHPVLGIGPGQVKRLYPIYAPPEAVRRHTSHLHDSPLQIAVERGLPGLVAWLAMFTVFVVRAAAILRRIPPAAADERALVLGAIAAVIAFLVAGLFEYNFGDTEVLLVAMTLMAIPFVVERDLDRRALS